VLLDRIQQPLRIVAVGKESHAGLHRFGESLRCTEFFNPESIVGEDSGVGIDVSFKSHPSAKQPSEQCHIVSPGDFFELLLA
jgi:hypothetical protein